MNTTDKLPIPEWAESAKNEIVARCTLAGFGIAPMHVEEIIARHGPKDLLFSQRQLPIVIAERDALRLEITSLLRFAGKVLDQHYNDGDIGDVEGASIQEWATKHGLLDEVTRTEPCGEGCVCSGITEFPTQCFVRSKLGEKAVAYANGTEGDGPDFSDSPEQMEARIEKTILGFAEEQWGKKDMVGIGLKLGEEAGEIAGALVKIPEGRATNDDLDKELGDILIVLSQLAAKRDTTLVELRRKRFEQIQARAKK